MYNIKYKEIIKMKNIYPVIFTDTKDIVLVEVPDLEILTEGQDVLNAIEMARDAIALKGMTMENNGEQIPQPTPLHEINPEAGIFSADGKSFISLVDIDFTEYRKKADNRAVRRNVTLPSWLNQEAEKAGINVSKVLQEALMAKLETSR